MALVLTATAAGQLDMGSLAAPEIFREKQGHNERPSFFFQAMSAEEVTLSNAMSTERQQYTARILPYVSLRACVAVATRSPLYPFLYPHARNFFVCRTQRLLWGSEDIIGMRAKLPIYDQRQHIIDTINGHQVCVLSGETGCGKSTQVRHLVSGLCLVGSGFGYAKCLNLRLDFSPLRFHSAGSPVPPRKPHGHGHGISRQDHRHTGKCAHVVCWLLAWCLGSKF